MSTSKTLIFGSGTILKGRSPDREQPRCRAEGGHQRCRLLFCLVSALSFTAIGSATVSYAQFAQQSPRLSGTDVAGSAQQGTSVALSADGNTAIVGAPYDNNLMGAAWVYTRTNGIWAQQGTKLVGTGALPQLPMQGQWVALSADGNTAMVASSTIWVFARSGGVWQQQGDPILPTSGGPVALSADGNTAIVANPGGGCDGFDGASVITRTNGQWTVEGILCEPRAVGSPASQGASVALSADGNTALVGGKFYPPGGAAWVYTRNNHVWTQQGPTLIGSGSGPGGGFGSSVALSGDGNTAIMGAPFESTELGAVWIFTRVQGVWTEQGTKLSGTGVIADAADQGISVALSGDGNTALVGGSRDYFDRGAAWIFTRNNGIWSQLGSKLVGRCAIGRAAQGTSVALSADGNTALVGGFSDNGYIGASWVFARSTNAVPFRTNTHDYDGDGCSDIVWRDSVGDLASWLMSGGQTTNSWRFGQVPSTWSIVAQRDFDGDGKSDLLWRDSSGNTAIWFMNGIQVASSVGLGNIATSWSIVATADFNGDGKGDLLWRDGNGNLAVWLMNGANVAASAGLGNISASWSVVGTGDFNGDGTGDILWRDAAGNTAIPFMNGTQVAATALVGNIPTNWSVIGTGDFNGDGKSDIVWRDDAGNAANWLMNGAAVLSSGGFGTVPTSWAMVETGDYDGDGLSDLLWRDASGNTVIWFMSGARVASSASLGNIPTTWTVQGVNAD
jgi:hypothetical protein